MITLVSLYKDQINKAIEFAEVPHNLEFQHFLALIHELKFDELRDYIAVLAGVSLTYYVVVKKYDFFGSESVIIGLLRQFGLSNDVYSSTLQCYSCCDTINITPQLGSLSQVSCSLQTSINKKIIPPSCKKCQEYSNIVFISGCFKVIPSLFIVELGHFTELNCSLMAKDIDESLSIRHDERTLNYTLVGFTLVMGNHFNLIIRLNELWYRYDDMLKPKLREWQKDTCLGKLNSILYVLYDF